MTGKALYEILDNLYIERHDKLMGIKYNIGEKNLFNIYRLELKVIEEKIKYYERIEINE